MSSGVGGAGGAGSIGPLGNDDDGDDTLNDIIAALESQGGAAQDLADKLKEAQQYGDLGSPPNFAAIQQWLMSEIKSDPTAFAKIVMEMPGTQGKGFQ